MLYGTTRRFLEVFGIDSLKDLPSLRELKEMAAQRGVELPGDASEGEADGEPGVELPLAETTPLAESDESGESAESDESADAEEIDDWEPPEIVEPDPKS